MWGTDTADANLDDAKVRYCYMTFCAHSCTTHALSFHCALCVWVLVCHLARHSPQGTLLAYAIC